MPEPTLLCPVCQSERWVCRRHPDRRATHDDCANPGEAEPCPLCNFDRPPAPPESWRARLHPDGAF